MTADGFGAGVQALFGELFAEPDDLVLQVEADRARVVVGPAGTGCERGLALELVAVNQLLDPVAGDLVVAGDLALGASLDRDRDDYELRERHAAPPRWGANHVAGQVPTIS